MNHPVGSGMAPRSPAPHAVLDVGVGDWVYSVPPEPAPAAAPLWKDCWNSVQRRRTALLALACLGAAAAVFHVQTSKATYRSTATLLIESGRAKILSIEEVYNAGAQDREYYQTQVEILRSRDVALRTVAATRLWNEPEFDPRRPGAGPAARLQAWLGTPPKAEVWTPQSLANATVAKLQAATTVEPVRLSQLVRVSFEAQDPALAARVANAAAQSYIQADTESRTRLQLGVNTLLQERLTALREKLLQSEQALQAFREKQGLVNAGGQQGVANQQLSEIAQRLVSARVRRAELESAYQQVQRAGDGDAAAAPAILGRPGMLEARSRVTMAAAKVMEYDRTYGDAHAKVLEARAEYEAAKQALKTQTLAVVAAVRGDLLAARDTERSLEAALGSARGVVQSENRQEFQLGVLEREVQANRQLYEIFLSRTKETSIDLQAAAVARIVDQAAVPGAPLRPNKAQVVGLSFLLSLLAGAVASIVFDRSRNTVRDAGDAEQRLGRPVLASVPDAAADGAALARSVIDQPGSQHAQAIRTARTGILLTGFDLSRRVLLVTSTMAGEGRTTFCTNLACAHAMTRRTLLIDCDLRNPSIGLRLGLGANAPGLADLLLGRAEVKDCMHPVAGAPMLMVMPAGNVPTIPEELLLSNAFREVLTSLAGRVDEVILDSPPVEDHSDALIVAQQVANTVYLVRAGATPHPRAQLGMQRLQRAGANIVGLVLNRREPAAPAGRSVGLTELLMLRRRADAAAPQAAGPGPA